MGMAASPGPTPRAGPAGSRCGPAERMPEGCAARARPPRAGRGGAIPAGKWLPLGPDPPLGPDRIRARPGRHTRAGYEYESHPVCGRPSAFGGRSRGLPRRSRGGHGGFPAGHEVVTGAAPPVTRWSRGLPRRSRGGHGGCPAGH
jgi:hypothetical protein